MTPGAYADFAEGREQARFTDWLQERSEPDWTAATDHRFVRELAAGTIDDAVFRRYLVQDYAFVETLTGAFGHAVGRAPTMAAKGELAAFLGVLTSDESDYFERAFDALSVPERDRRDPEKAPATLAFEDLLIRASLEGGYAETLAVLVPAEWIYLTWATALANDPPDRFYLGEWIELHANPAFESFVGWLREELDAIGPALSPARERRVDRLFRRTASLEVAFFDAAYE